MRAPAKGAHCSGCGRRTIHVSWCPGAFGDERPVECEDCDAVLANPEDAKAHQCPAEVPGGAPPPRAISGAKVVFGVKEPGEGLRVYLEDGAVLEKVVVEGREWWRECAPVARTFRAAVLAR